MSANYGLWQYDSGFGDMFDVTGFGLAASYDLGGGLSAHIGWGSEDYEGTGFTSSSWSMGLAMSF